MKNTEFICSLSGDWQSNLKPWLGSSWVWQSSVASSPSTTLSFMLVGAGQETDKSLLQAPPACSLCTDWAQYCQVLAVGPSHPRHPHSQRSLGHKCVTNLLSFPELLDNGEALCRFTVQSYPNLFREVSHTMFNGAYIPASLHRSADFISLSSASHKTDSRFHQGYRDKVIN